MVEFSAENLQNVGYTVTGRLPEKKGEIAITELLYRQFKEYGFQNTEFKENVAADALTMDSTGANSIIGKHITLSNGLNTVNGKGYTFEIVGVVDTQFDYVRYEAFLPEDENAVPGPEEDNVLMETVLAMELMSELNYGFHALGFTTDEDIESLADMMPAQTQHLGTYFSGWNKEYFITVQLPSDGEEEENNGIFFNNNLYEGATSSALSHLSINWIDGVARTQLAANEVVLPSAVVANLYPTDVMLELDEQKLVDAAIDQGLFEQADWDATDPSWNYYDRLVDATMRYSTRNAANPDSSVDHYGFDLAVNEKLTAIAAHLYGFTPAEFPQSEYYSLVDKLQFVSAGNKEYSLTNWDIESMLLRSIAQKDVVEKQLWANPEFVELMLAAPFAPSFDGEWENLPDDEKINLTIPFYTNYLSDYAYGYEQNPYGSVCGKEISQIAKTKLLEISGITEEEFLAQLVIERFEKDFELQHNKSLGVYDLKIVGIYDSNAYFYTNMIVSDTVVADYKTWFTEQAGNGSYFFTEEIAEHDNGIWAYALAPLGTDTNVIRKLVEMSYDETGDLKFKLQNSVMDTLDTFNEFIEIGSKIFLYVGIGFAVFSALLLMNFISTSISYKKREIGVLRAVGARSSDVFKIFFSEALIIAVINFIFSTALVVAGIMVANGLMHRNGITITLLHYGVRQFGLMLAISVAVALLASFLPVNKIARKKPVDAIKDR